MQVKIYGIRSKMSAYQDDLSDVIHSCIVEAFDYPSDKRVHRFFALAREDIHYPPGRSDNYTIIEISLFEGRTIKAKKTFYALLYERCHTLIGIEPIDIEVTLSETPRHNWAIRGLPGDELELEYPVEV